MSTRVYDPVAIARQFKFVRETLGPNRGVFVEAIQRIGDGKPGDSWCMDFASLVLWVAYQGPAPLPRTGSCAAAYEVAKQQGYLTTDPQAGDVYFFVDRAEDHAHHVGIVTAVRDQDFDGIAGNTSKDGQSSNGTGVFEHPIARGPSVTFVRLPETI